MKKTTNKKITTTTAEKSGGGSAAGGASKRSKAAASPLKRGSKSNTANGRLKSKPKAASTIQQPAVPSGKLGVLVELLSHTDGATLSAMMAATGWQAHSVRGAMAGAIKKRLGLNVISKITGTTRHWRILEQGA